MKLKKISKITLIIFMILEPLFDIYYLYSDNLREMFKFAPPTIIRMLIMTFLIITSYLFVRKKINKKYLISFISIYLLYTILHLYNCSIFNSSIVNYQDYSILSEIFYLIRMICPILLIFVTYDSNLEDKEVSKIIVSVYLIFASIMVLTNFLGVALTSYSNGNRIIAANFFSWFNPNTYSKYGYELIASKGIFHMANQISGVMTMMLPLLIYIILKDKFKLINMITLFLTMLSMLMLGTRIASLGMLAVIIFCLVMYYFFQFIKKKKLKITNNIVCILVFISLVLLIYPYTPVANRTYASSNHDMVMDNIKASGALEELVELRSKLPSMNEEEQKISKINFLEKYQHVYEFDEEFFLKLYNYKEDPDFWFSILDKPYKDRCDHRELKNLITKWVFEKNNNKLDYLLGFSFERPRNALIYMENDIYMHIYSIGILGIILFIFPYIGISIYSLYQIFKNKKKFTYLNMTYIMCICLVYLIGPLTGNIFDEWIVTLFLGFISGLLLRNIKEAV